MALCWSPYLLLRVFMIFFPLFFYFLICLFRDIDRITWLIQLGFNCLIIFHFVLYCKQIYKHTRTHAFQRNFDIFSKQHSNIVRFEWLEFYLNDFYLRMMLMYFQIKNDSKSFIYSEFWRQKILNVLSKYGIHWNKYFYYFFIYLILKSTLIDQH